MPEEYKITHYIDPRVIAAMKRFNKLHMEDTILALLDEAEEMRSLLVLFASDEAQPVINVQNPSGEECLLCESGEYGDLGNEPFLHKPECPWLRARVSMEKEQQA